MKKTVILIIGILILLIGGYNILDAYLCSHLYYGWGPFSSCVGGQGKGIDIVGTFANRKVVFMGIISALIPVLYLMLAKKISLRAMMILFFGGAALYITGISVIKDALFGQGFMILVFNIAVLFFLLYWLIASMTVLGNKIFHYIKRDIGHTIHEIFLKFTLGLIVFCFFNVILLQLHLFYGVILVGEIIALTYLLVKEKKYLHQVISTIESFLSDIRRRFSFSQNPGIYIFFIGILIISVLYVYMGFNLAYIPYPTAWDANHAYIFFPRIWAINSGLYRGNEGTAGSMPFLWYGFLTFRYKLASVMPGSSGLFGISPDSLTILMNFWSGPFVLMASGFTLHAVLKMLPFNQNDKNQSNITMICILLGLLLVLLWLTSGMGAFLVFVDNKTDLAVLFFTIIAIYTGIQFLIAIKDNQGNKFTKHYAILSGFFFAASILAKPTGMFDVMHFAILFFLQWNRILLAVGGYTAILGALGLTKLLLVEQFLTTSQSYILLVVGMITAIIGFIPTLKKKFRTPYLRYFFIRLSTIIVILIIYKGPFSIIQQLKKDGNINIPNTIRTIFFAESHTVPKRIMLASNLSLETLSGADTNTGKVIESRDDVILKAKEQCIATAGTQNLYANLKSAGNDGATEDLGRYVGYGQKTFKDIWLLSWMPLGCYSIYSDARELCFKTDEIKNGTKQSILSLVDSIQIVSGSPIENFINSLKEADDSIVESRIKRDLVTYIQSNTLIVSKNGISIPYKLLVPFNITTNWSLQNLSSYYTDIGILWLLGFFIALLGIIYGLITRNRLFTQFSVVAIGSWVVWRVIGSAILWYSLGLIVRTIIGVVVFVYNMMSSPKEKNTQLQTNLTYVFIGLLVLRGVIQLGLNLLRIGSQGAGGPFSWYKSNVGEKYVFNDQLLADRTVKIGFNASDVLDLQFPHYKNIINILNTRGKDEGAVIAGTYMQYFINDQSTIEADGFLANFWQNLSDDSICNTYLRLKDQKKKYLIIDPNIASVVMGEGNKSLFERFFAVVGPDGKLLQQGTLTMLQSLVQGKYLKLLSTNNLITKYSFIVPDEYLSEKLNIYDSDALLLERAKMTAARFFPNGDTYGNIAIQFFASRMKNYEAIIDISDVIGKPIREDVVVGIAKYVDAGVKPDQYKELQSKIQDLTQDERITLQQYFAYKKAQQDTKNPNQFREYVVGLVSQSINNGSQVIALTLE